MQSINTSLATLTASYISYLYHKLYDIYLIRYIPPWVYTIGISHLTIVTSHLHPCYIPKKSIHILPCTTKIGIYHDARTGQNCLFHGIYHGMKGIYHGIYQKNGIYHAIYHDATTGPGSRQVVYTIIYIMLYSMVYTYFYDIYHGIYLTKWYIPWYKQY